MATVTRVFPNEIFKSILRHLSQNDPSSLLRTSLVCRDFLDISRREYFHYFVTFRQFAKNDEASLNHLRVLLESPFQTLHRYLKCLNVTQWSSSSPGEGYDIFGLASVLDLTSLKIRDTYVNCDESLQGGFPNLTSFHAEGIRWRFDDLAEFAQHHPLIKDLSFVRCSFYRPREKMREKVLANLRRFGSHLEYLEISQTAASVIFDGLLPHSQIDSLKSLKLTDPFDGGMAKEEDDQLALQTFFKRQGATLLSLEARQTWSRSYEAEGWFTHLRDCLPRTSLEEAIFGYARGRGYASGKRSEHDFFNEDFFGDWDCPTLKQFTLKHFEWTQKVLDSMKKNITRKKFPILKHITFEHDGNWNLDGDAVLGHFADIGMVVMI
ncbi:hypothetical protein BT69DRAFT_1281093 [Atractiella rhizophila]|nr:hypothetical protein BT69DRAFT_1281093 [Atractiella rhizophila]